MHGTHTHTKLSFFCMFIFSRLGLRFVGFSRMDDVDESRKEEDRAFILRLPPEQAREVRQRLAENNFQDIRLHIDPATDRHKTPGGFKGRTGTFSMAAPAASGAHVRLPLTVMDLPTMLECYRTIDGKAGEYVKTADVSQILVVHNEVRIFVCLCVCHYCKTAGHYSNTGGTIVKQLATIVKQLF